MEIFLLSILFLIPVVGLFSGLSVAASVPLFTFGVLVALRKSLEFNIKNYKLEISFVLWILASYLWSLNPPNSFLSGIKFSTEFFIGLVLIKNIAKIDISITKIEKVIIAALFCAIVAFFAEYLTGGKMSLMFRELTQKKESHIFFLHNLDRGVALLALLSWVVIGIFLQQKKWLLASLIYFVTLTVLILSDNLAGLVGHIAAIMVFFATRFTIFRNPKILCCLLLAGSALMIIFAFKVNALEVALENDTLPLSAKHRLFIWNFVAESSQENPILGIGFNSSRIFPVGDEQIISLFGHRLHPLPMHPHNNIMQVYFELGAIGLILYLSLACKYLLIIGRNYRVATTEEKSIISAKYACFSLYFIISMISYNMWQSWFVASAIFIGALFVLVDGKNKFHRIT